MAAGLDLRLRLPELVERAAQVHRACARDFRIAPRHRPRQRPVDLADPRAIAEPPQPVQGGGGQLLARDLGDATRREIEERRSRRDFRKRGDSPPRDDPTAQRRQLRNEGVDEPAAAALDDRPAQ